LLGYPDQCVRKTREAAALAREISHPFSLAIALACWSWAYQFCGNEEEVTAQAEALHALSTEQLFPFLVAWAKVVQGWSLAAQGLGEKGIAQLQSGLSEYRATGARLWVPYQLALLAEAYGKAARIEDGLAALDDALAAVNETGERWYEAELYRLKGTLMLQSQVQCAPGQVSEKAQVCFQKAIEIARNQQAKSPELRAVMSLARLLRDTGHRDEARALLAEIYNWFTEGFDTADLKDAKALLDELSA
jgi:predicted ATPase